MTSYEAETNVNKCEAQIVQTYYEMKRSAKNVGYKAVEEADRKVQTNYWVLVISAIGLFLCILKAWFLGIVLIIVGVGATISLHGIAKDTRNKITNAQQNLSGIIDSNDKI